ncbi:uncharacterized protein [Macrobrachium rosenbergii]|uniref:uncharacterized protein n=1 Tax=Macrobrachium rosenbergii TaxID=79674 RepID=UPI0034D58043
MMAWRIHLLVVLTTAFLIVLSPSLTQGAEISVHFIQSPLFDFFMATNMTFDRGSAKLILPGLNTCGCRSACFTYGDGCKAWASVSLENGITECRIANEGPMTLVPYGNGSSTYFFKKSSVPGTYTWEADNLLYVALNGSMSTQDAKNNCAKIPGHRLIIVKSKATYDHFLARAAGNGQPFWVMDLKKKTSTELVWGDGTSPDPQIVYILLNSATELTFVLYDNHIEDAAERQGPFRVLCQANPLGVQW